MLDCLRRPEADQGQPRNRGVLPREPIDSVVGGGHFCDGHAAQRHHDDRHDRPGLQRRPPLHPVLFRPAAGDDRVVGYARAVFLQLRCVYGIRVSGAPVRRQDAQLHEPALSDLARYVMRCRGVGAGRGPLARTGMGPDRNRTRDHNAGRDLHDVRRRPGGHLDRRQDHGAHRRGAVRRDHHRHPRVAGRRRPVRRVEHRGRDGTTANVRLLLRPDEPVHVLVGNDRGALPLLLVLRHGSKPGSAVSHGTLGRRGEALAADECVLEDPAAALGALAGRPGVRLLRFQPAADALQPGPRRAAEGRVPTHRRTRLCRSNSTPPFRRAGPRRRRWQRSAIPGTRRESSSRKAR